MLFLSLIIKSIETICIVYNFNAFLLRIILLYFRIIFPAIGWLAACYNRFFGFNYGFSGVIVPYLKRSPILFCIWRH